LENNVASNINYLSINENFPVAGQDNDTQVFRDNFDTIKNSFRNAQTEITALQANTAKTNLDNDFGLYKIANAVLQNNRTAKWDGGEITASPTTVDYENGSYQIYRLGASVSMDFLNFAGDPTLTGEVTPVGMSKVTLELYSTGGSYTLSFTTSGGTVIKKDPSFPGTVTINSSTNPIFIEVWRHSPTVIFMRYLGQYS
jgi:hypothetical protein